MLKREQYRFRDGDILNAEALNDRILDIDARIHVLEEAKNTYDEAVVDLLNFSIAQLNILLEPILAEGQEILLQISQPPVQQVTIPDTGDSNPAIYTLSPQSPHIQVTSNDPNGANITIANLFSFDLPQNGQHIMISNVGINEITILQIDGQVELLGIDRILRQWEKLMLDYEIDRWVGRLQPSRWV